MTGRRPAAPPLVILHVDPARGRLAAALGGLPRTSGIAFVLVPAGGAGEWGNIEALRRVAALPVVPLAGGGAGIVPAGRRPALAADTIHLAVTDGGTSGEALESVLGPVLATAPPGRALVVADRATLPGTLRERLGAQGVPVVAWPGLSGQEIAGASLPPGAWKSIASMVRAAIAGAPVAPGSALESLAAALASLPGLGEKGRLRLWLPRCPDGSTAFALAALLAERLAPGRDGRCRVRILAGMAGEAALAAARRGLCAASALAFLPGHLRARHFLAETAGLRAVPALRAMVLPAPARRLLAGPLPPLDAVACEGSGTLLAGLERLAAPLAPGGLLLIDPPPLAPPLPGLVPAGGHAGLFRRIAAAGPAMPAPGAEEPSGSGLELSLLEERLADLASAAADGEAARVAQAALVRALELAELEAALLARAEGDALPPVAAGRLALAREAMREALAAQMPAGEAPPAMPGVPVPLGALLEQLRAGTADLARACGVELRVVPSSARAEAHPGLLGDCLRSLLARLARLAEGGRIVAGCRRRGAHRRIELWARAAAFGEAGPAGAAALRLAARLGRPVELRRVGALVCAAVELPAAGPGGAGPVRRQDGSRGGIVLVEQDAEIRAALRRLLEAAGHRVREAEDADATTSDERPALVVLGGPAGRGGTGRRRRAGRVLLLARDPAAEACRADLVLPRPLRADMLLDGVAALAGSGLPGEGAAGAVAAPGRLPVFLVMPSAEQRAALAAGLAGRGFTVAAFAGGADLLAALEEDACGCVVVAEPEQPEAGLELLARLRGRLGRLAVVLLAPPGDVPLAVQAMRAGACEVLELPVGEEALAASLGRALAGVAGAAAERGERRALAERLAQLSERERQILAFVTAGLPNKEIAFRLGISRRTVENHRARIMQKMKARSFAELVRQSADLGL